MTFGFHIFAARITKTKLVLAMLLVLTWSSFPSTACVCADGTMKVFCSRICSGGKCCCSSVQRSCPGCACHSGVSTSSTESTECVDAAVGHQLSKPCGCHRLAKEQATYLARVSAEQDDDN